MNLQCETTDVTEKEVYHQEYETIKKMYATLIGLLLLTVVGGFAGAYHFNARLAVAESIIGQGKRFSREDFDTFYEHYVEDKTKTAEEITMIKQDMRSLMVTATETNVMIKFLVKKQEEKTP